MRRTARERMDESVLPKRNAWTEQKVVFAHVEISEAWSATDDRRTRRWNVAASVVAAEICHQADERKDLSFKRAVPSVQVRGVVDGGGCAIVGVADENVAAGRDLCEERWSEDECRHNGADKRTHGKFFRTFFVGCGGECPGLSDHGEPPTANCQLLFLLRWFLRRRR